MVIMLSTPFSIGTLKIPHRLIQGPLAGFSCAPFRALFSDFLSPGYCVTEMISAHDVIHKHRSDGRYLYRSSDEKILCYQLSGHEPLVLAEAARRIEALGADLIDINMGCPKPKIRKKGAGSALLEDEQRLVSVIDHVRRAITIPLTVKIRLQHEDALMRVVKAIEEAGADGLIVHGRRWIDDYDVPCHTDALASIKASVQIPVIGNGDIEDQASLEKMIKTGCDAYMISRAGTGKPWLYQNLLGSPVEVTHALRKVYLMKHLAGLRDLEDEHRAVLQSRTLFRYYFKPLQLKDPQAFFSLTSLDEIERFLQTLEFAP
ncbi:MAG: tRNA dihydrouridine synthase [Legionellaceae bacterium]